MNLLNLSRFINLLSTGLLTGILFGDRWGTTPVRPTLSASCFTQFQQGLHLNYVPLMPILMGISILSGVTASLLLRRFFKSRDFLFTAAGTLCIAGVFILTLIVNVPINNALMTWQITAPPPDWQELWRPWEQSHTVRTVVAVAGFVCQTMAIIGVGHSQQTGKAFAAGDAA